MMENTTIRLGKDQQIGATSATQRLVDAIFTGSVETRGGLQFQIGFVMDGGWQGAPEPAQASDFVRREFTHSTSLDAFHTAAQVGYALQAQFSAQAHYTLVAVSKGSAYTIQTGTNTRAYLVYNNKAQLFRNAAQPRALPENLAGRAPAVTHYRLKPGDKIVLSSDGLFNAINEQEFALIDRYEDPTGAAKHLSALAMGRNVVDNVSVVVLRNRSRVKMPLWSIILIGIALLAAAVTAIFIATAPQKQTKLPPDSGVAILVEGAVSRVPADGSSLSDVDVFGIIQPGETLSTSSQSVANIQLKTVKAYGDDTSTVNINVDFDLVPDTKLRFIAINHTTYENGASVEPEFSDLTVTALLGGGVLIRSEELRAYRVNLPRDSEGAFVFVMLNPGRNSTGSMGVRRMGETVSVYCLSGHCQAFSGEQLLLDLYSPTIGRVDLSTLSTQGPMPMVQSDWIPWNELCGEVLGP